jgi:hypothetical protein
MPLIKYDNLLSPEILEKLYIFTRLGNQPTRTNFFNYDYSVIGTSNAIFCFDLTEDLKQEVLNELTKKGVFSATPKKVVTYLHLFSRGSFIPWHNDYNYKYTGTIYLNKEWNKNLGGLFIYEDGEELKCIEPKFNSGIFFEPPMGHTTSLTAINAPLRESLQIFVEEF